MDFSNAKVVGASRLVFFVTVSMFTFSACGNGADGQARPLTDSSPSAQWLLRGGDINRASMMSEWSGLDEEGRLASAADLVTFKRRSQDLPIPELGEFERLARALEARLTAANKDGNRDSDYVGTVVDEVWPEIAARQQ
jgi:hypothetical protein